MSIATILIACACALSCAASAVRYDGGVAYQPDYIEYGDRRPDNGQDTRVITFPHSKEYHGRPSAFDDRQTPEQPPECVGCAKDHQIPLELIMKLNAVGNVSELWKFVSTDTPFDSLDSSTDAIANRFGGDSDVERSAAVVPKPALCSPELTTVPLISDEAEATGVFYFPSCTRVMRCGGCCSHTLLSCQPTQTEQLSFQVIKSEFGGGNQLSYRGKEIVLVEQHTKCKCGCIVKEEHCNQFQEYKKGECRCACMNTDDESKCIQESSTKLWDPNACVCRCRETLECTSGSYFDQSTCQCVQIPSRTLDPGADRTRFKVKPIPIPIEPQEDDKYEV